MQDVEERLVAWMTHATTAERRAGPTAQDLGGIDAAEAAHLATGPFLSELIKAAAHQQSAEADGVVVMLRSAVLTGLRQQQRHSAFAGAVDVLVTRPELARALGTDLPRALLARLDEVHRAEDDLAIALIAAEATECLVQLSLARITTPARLLGELAKATEDVDQLPEPFAVRLPRMLGILEAHYPGTGPGEALERLLALDHTHRDAAFEIALAELRSALEAPDYTTMIKELGDVRRHLAELIAVSPERLDAQIYHGAIDAALAIGGPNADLRVPAIASALHETLQHYRAWRYESSTPAWSRPRQDDIAAWAELAVILDAAAIHMGDGDPWYGDGRGIVSALSRAYTADRTVSVLLDSPTAAVVETLVAPVIEDVFLRNDNRLLFLQHAVDKDEALRADPAANQLLAALRARSAAPAPLQVEPGAGGLGKDRRWHLLAQTVSPSEFNNLAQQAEVSTLDKLELALRTHEDVVAGAVDPKISRLMDKLINDMRQSADWIPDIAAPFHALLDATVRYAFLCYNVGRKMGGSFTEYLRLRDASGKKQKVDEALFHQHFFEVLAVSAFFRVVDAEVINYAGGRVDILVSFGPVRFNVECKIEEHDASEASLRQYAGQAAEYQNTNAPFAILLVLDKTNHAEGTVNIFDSIWIENVERPGESEPRRVVTIRVPGGRDAPSSLETPAP
jgi:hypothetical protein